MNKLRTCILPALALFVASSMAGHADGSPSAGHPDLFSQIQNNPNTYWVPAPTPPPPSYVAGPEPYYYYGPPPPYYGPPPARVYYGGPRFFFGFRFH